MELSIYTPTGVAPPKTGVSVSETPNTWQKRGERPKEFFDSARAGHSWRLCANLIAGSPAYREMRGGGYPANAQRPLDPDKYPRRSSAVLLYDAARCLHCLALDFDAKANPEQARADAFDAMKVLTKAGFTPIMDTNPMGGWHVYARLHRPQNHHSTRQLCAAFEDRWRSFDKMPLITDPLHACIRPPGSPHKKGGYQTLLIPPEAAQAALQADPGPAAWNRLRHMVKAHTFTASPKSASAGQWDLTKAKDVRKHDTVSAHAEHLATHGHCPTRNCRHPHKPFKSPSEVRFSIVRSAVNRGWAYQDILDQLPRWHWLRESLHGKAPDALARDFHNAKASRAYQVAKKLNKEADAKDTTGALVSPYTQHKPSLFNTAGGTPPSLIDDPATDIYLHIRKFLAHCETYFRQNKLSPTQRASVRSVVLMCLLQGSLASNAGLRSYAEAANLAHTTVSTALRSPELAGLLSCVHSDVKGTESQVWAIHTDLAADLDPITGKVWAVHPVFRVLGDHLEADIYQYLQAHKYQLHSPTSIANALGYDARRVSEALYLLAGWQLATKHNRQWQLGPANPDAIAHQLGGFDHLADQHARHVQDRQEWRRRLARSQPHPDQIQWNDEFDLVEDDENEWIAKFANGTAPPTSRPHLHAI